MKRKIDYKNIANFFYEVGQLRKIPRAHQQEFLTSDPSDNISSHSYRVSVIALLLSHLEGVDPYKTLAMALLHDLPETRSGDQNWIHKRYVKVFEEEIIKDQFENLPNETEFLEIANEYGERKSKEAIVAKDADILDQLILLCEYRHQGNQEAASWLKNGGQQMKMLKTKSAQMIGKEILKTGPSNWVKNAWTSKRR